MTDSPRYVVLGATGGIGSATARRLARSGARLVLAARGEDRLKSLADELDAEAHALDAVDADAVDALFAGVRGDLAGAVCCVGSLLLKPAHRTTPQELRETLDANVTSAFNVVRSAAGVLQRDGGGAIVLLTSAVARLGMSNHEAIAAAKAGVIGLTLAAAATYAPKGVRVNAVAPGLTETPMTAHLTADPTSRSTSERLHPMQTIGQPEEVASAIAWLLDPEQRIVTGQVLGVDAGLGTLQPRLR